MTQTLKPIIKWVGGKRQLLPQLNQYKPAQFKRYYEPFIGGGAFLFNLMPCHAVINDLNPELTNLYQVVKDHPLELIEKLKYHQAHNTKEYYLKVRAYDRDGTIETMSDIERAARLIYMLKVDYNGLYRVNQKGQFNVPYGRYTHPNIVSQTNLMNVHHYLKDHDIQITNGNYQDAIADVKAQDFVYFDPPYIPLNQTSNFTAYTKEDFDLNCQKQLRDCFFELANKGAYVMLSNSDTPLTRELYQNAHIHSVKATRSINTDTTKRGKVGEVIVTNY